MNTLLTIIIVGAGLFIAYKTNILLGLAVTLLVIGYAFYHFRPQLYRSRGAKLFSEAKYSEAKQWYKKAIDTGHAKGDIRIEYSYVLLRTGNIDEAEQVVNNMLCYKIKPEYKSKAIIQRCMCYYKQGNLDEAIEDAMNLYNDGYRSITLYGMLGFFNILKAPMAQETFDFCKEAMDYADDDRDIMDNMLICYYNRGEYEKAKELSDKVLENQPKFVEAWYHGAQIDVKLGDYSAALEKLERIKDCNRSFMTTISEAAVDALKVEAAEKAER